MEEGFKQAVHKWLERQDLGFNGVKEVLKVEQLSVEVPFPFCGEGTCWESEIHIRIYYVVGPKDGNYAYYLIDYPSSYDYIGNYIDFIRDLAELPDLSLTEDA